MLENPVLKWDHIIDSRPPTDMPDQGSFATLPDGHVAETGTMYNPKTGKYQEYVEVWKRYPPEIAAVYCVLERVEPPRSGCRAFLGRVGNRALGLCQDASERYTAVKWEMVGGEMTRVFEVGDPESLPEMPSGTFCTGQLVDIDGREWSVRTAGIL